VVVEAKDNKGGRALQTFALTARANRSPLLNAIPDGTVTAGGTFRADMRASDPDGDAVSYRLDAAPAGTTIDARGRIAWSPADGTPRTETVTVTASDPFGAWLPRWCRCV